MLRIQNFYRYYFIPTVSKAYHLSVVSILCNRKMTATLTAQFYGDLQSASAFEFISDFSCHTKRITFAEGETEKYTTVDCVVDLDELSRRVQEQPLYVTPSQGDGSTVITKLHFSPCNGERTTDLSWLWRIPMMVVAGYCPFIIYRFIQVLLHAASCAAM